MLHTSLGIPSNLTIHLSFSLPLHPSSICFCHPIAVSLFPMCAALLVLLQYAMYVQYVWAYRPHERVSVFSHCSALRCLNQDMLWAADDDGDSVMWECHQSLGSVTGFCLPASDAWTVAFSAHFAVAAVGFFLLLSFFVPISRVFYAGKIQRPFNKLSLTHWHVYACPLARSQTQANPGFPRLPRPHQIMYYYSPEAVWLKNTWDDCAVCQFAFFRTHTFLSAKVHSHWQVCQNAGHYEYPKGVLIKVKKLSVVRWTQWSPSWRKWRHHQSMKMAADCSKKK